MTAGSRRMLVLSLGLVLLAGCASDPTGGRDETVAPPASSASPVVVSTSPSNSAQSASATRTSITGENQETVACAYLAGGDSTSTTPVDPPSTNDVPASGTFTQTLVMTAGEVRLTLDRAKAPCTVNSFNALAQQGFYNNTDCHRLVDTGIFILQCGDPSGTGHGGPGYRYADELSGNETYPAGTVAMANAGPDSNGSQFFIVWADSELPPSYTVFGTVDQESLLVIQGIAAKGVSKDASPAPIAEAHIVEVRAG